MSARPSIPVGLFTPANNAWKALLDHTDICIGTFDDRSFNRNRELISRVPYNFASQMCWLNDKYIRMRQITNARDLLLSADCPTQDLYYACLVIREKKFIQETVCDVAACFDRLLVWNETNRTLLLAVDIALINSLRSDIIIKYTALVLAHQQCAIAYEALQQ